MVSFTSGSIAPAGKLVSHVIDVPNSHWLVDWMVLLTHPTTGKWFSSVYTSHRPKPIFTQKDMIVSCCQPELLSAVGFHLGAPRNHSTEVSITPCGNLSWQRTTEGRSRNVLLCPIQPPVVASERFCVTGVCLMFFCDFEWFRVVFGLCNIFLRICVNFDEFGAMKVLFRGRGSMLK